MLVPNLWQLDQLPFLKRPTYKWHNDKSQGQHTKLRLLQNLRNSSYQCSKLIAKIFCFQIQQRKDTSQTKQNQINQPLIYEQLIITTQKQIVPLQKFYYLLNQNMGQQDFSVMVSRIHKFVNRTRLYFKDIIRAKGQIQYGNKQFLNFGIYLQKSHPSSLNFDAKKIQNQQQLIQKLMKTNKFYLKGFIDNYDFQPFKDLIQIKQKIPEPFPIDNELIFSKLIRIYFNLSNTKFNITNKQIRKYAEMFDRSFKVIDQEYLKLQVYRNYPILRSKYFLPVRFNDFLNNQRLDGPIFSNSDPDCMFNHFIGYNADNTKTLQGNNCSECRMYFDGVQENPILTHLRDNVFNPYKTDVFFTPQYNRFKLILKVPVEKPQNQQQEQNQSQAIRQRTQIKYLNYLHMRSNLRKIYYKKRNKFNGMFNQQNFSLFFQFLNKKLLIIDPARGRNCAHYQFTDLRLFYLNKVTQNSFKCPICSDIMSDNDILYLKQVQIILKYFRFKTSKFLNQLVEGQFYVNHFSKKVFISYKKKNKKNQSDKEILEIKNYYYTFIDPYISFNQYSLGIPDKYQRKMREKYLFGFEKENEQSEDDQFDQLFNNDDQQAVQEKQIKNPHKMSQGQNANPQKQ